MQEKEQKISPIKQRILQFADTLGISKREFYIRIGVSRGTLESHTGITEDIMAKFIATYPNVSTDWLLTGRGDMFVSDEPALNYEGKGVPYYNVDFCGGFDIVFNDQTQVPDGYIFFPQYNKADSWANITGNSMEPLISNGDIIALKWLPDWADYLLYGEVYGIMTEKYRTVKRVRKSDNPDHILLVPENKDEYDIQEIPKRIITGVWQVLGCAKKIF